MLQLKKFVGATNTTYEEVLWSLDDYAGETIWIRFIGQSGTGGWSWGICLDNITVGQIYSLTLAVDPENAGTVYGDGEYFEKRQS